MTLDEFLPYVLPRAAGCPDALALHNIRLAAIELCRKARIWREYQLPVLTVTDQTAYNYLPGADEQIIELLSLTLAGENVDVVEPEIGKARDRSGWVSTYAYGGFKQFELRPAQVEDLEIITYCVVAPTIDAQDVPDELARYAEEIGGGALARILKISDKPYTDKRGAQDARDDFDAAIGQAITDASTGRAKVARRTTPRYF
jgi:hypothetical protein